MNYSKLGIFEIAIKYTQDLRRSLFGKPSAATRAAWRLEDAHREMLQDYYARQEDDEDDFTCDFTSEVRLK